MHKLYELKDMLCEELEEYGSKGKLDVGSLDVVDKLAHAIKNIDKIIECSEEDYSYGTSYARGRMGNVRRDAMGRYSRDGRYSYDEADFRTELQKLMHDAPNERIKQKIQNIVSDM